MKSERISDGRGGVVELGTPWNSANGPRGNYRVGDMYFQTHAAAEEYYRLLKEHDAKRRAKVKATRKEAGRE